jgi:hypothetical protein
MKCDKCGYSDNGTGDWAHACGPVAIQQKPVANTRINELIEQCTDHEFSDCIGGYETFDKEKFAQLIIKECTSVVTGGRFLHDQAPAAHFARECEKAIQRHFEVTR